MPTGRQVWNGDDVFIRGPGRFVVQGRIMVVNAVITIAIRLRYDYDPTTTYRTRLLPFDAIRREQKMNMSIFRRSRVVVVS